MPDRRAGSSGSRLGTATTSGPAWHWLLGLSQRLIGPNSRMWRQPTPSHSPSSNCGAPRIVAERPPVQGRVLAHVGALVCLIIRGMTLARVTASHPLLFFLHPLNPYPEPILFFRHHSTYPLVHTASPPHPSDHMQHDVHHETDQTARSGPARLRRSFPNSFRNPGCLRNMGPRLHGLRWELHS